MKKILVIQGGGRPHGNTAQLVDAFVRGARDAGKRVEVVNLSKIEVKGCTGCNACRYGKPCVQRDGFGELVPELFAADTDVYKRQQWEMLQPSMPLRAKRMRR